MPYVVNPTVTDKTGRTWTPGQVTGDNGLRDYLDLCFDQGLSLVCVGLKGDIILVKTEEYIKKVQELAG